MPEFKEKEQVGTGTINLKTFKKADGSFETLCETKLDKLNAEGTIEELTKIVNKLYKEDLCSQGKTCQKCGNLIPNHYENELCMDCYKKEQEPQQAIPVPQKEQATYKGEQINPVA